MSYNHNHYNYQIGVIFAILVGGCLFLAIVVIGIYFMVNAMRDGERKKLQSGRNSVAGNNWQADNSYRPQSNINYNPAPQQQYDEPPKSQMSGPMIINNSSYTPVPSTIQYQPNPYNQVPLATPATQQYINTQQIPQYQPDVIYTQGPSGYIQQQPVEYTINQIPTNFHQSSV